MRKLLTLNNLSLFLVLLLYVLIYFLRLHQGLPPFKLFGSQPKIEILKNQRDFLDQRISQILPITQAELLLGILLGQNKELPGLFEFALRDTSIFTYRCCLGTEFKYSSRLIS